MILEQTGFHDFLTQLNVHVVNPIARQFFHDIIAESPLDSHHGEL